ncbi:MAG: hypothetical protein EZS28_043307, partial [Streblomastix strix]
KKLHRNEGTQNQKVEIKLSDRGNRLQHTQQRSAHRKVFTNSTSLPFSNSTEYDPLNHHDIVHPIGDGSTHLPMTPTSFSSSFADVQNKGTPPSSPSLSINSVASIPPTSAADLAEQHIIKMVEEGSVEKSDAEKQEQKVGQDKMPYHSPYFQMITQASLDKSNSNLSSSMTTDCLSSYTQSSSSYSSSDSIFENIHMSPLSYVGRGSIGSMTSSNSRSQPNSPNLFTSSTTPSQINNQTIQASAQNLLQSSKLQQTSLEAPPFIMPPLMMNITRRKSISGDDPQGDYIPLNSYIVNNGAAQAAAVAATLAMAGESPTNSRSRLDMKNSARTQLSNGSGNLVGNQNELEQFNLPTLMSRTPDPIPSSDSRQHQTR